MKLVGFWDVAPCSQVDDRRFRGTTWTMALMMEAASTSETSFTICLATLSKTAVVEDKPSSQLHISHDCLVPSPVVMLLCNRML
jgi:hypothetical protein